MIVAADAIPGARSKHRCTELHRLAIREVDSRAAPVSGKTVHTACIGNARGVRSNAHAATNHARGVTPVLLIKFFL